MAKRFYTRLELQKALEGNGLTENVEYKGREIVGSPENHINYMPSQSDQIFADDGIHVRRISVQVIHLHKKKMDSIEEFMAKLFGVTPTSYAIKQPETDYLATYYDLNLFTKGAW